MANKYVTGIEDLQKNVFDPAIEKKKSAARAAVNRGAEVVAQAARSNIHHVSHELENSIKITPSAMGDENSYVVAVSASTEYGYLVEYGRAKAPAHPFMRPARDANRSRIVSWIKAALNS